MGWSGVTSCPCSSKNLSGLKVQGSSQYSGSWFKPQMLHQICKQMYPWLYEKIWKSVVCVVSVWLALQWRDEQHLSCCGAEQTVWIVWYCAVDTWAFRTDVKSLQLEPLVQRQDSNNPPVSDSWKCLCNLNEMSNQETVCFAQEYRNKQALLSQQNRRQKRRHYTSSKSLGETQTCGITTKKSSLLGRNSSRAQQKQHRGWATTQWRRAFLYLTHLSVLGYEVSSEFPILSCQVRQQDGFNRVIPELFQYHL